MDEENSVNISPLAQGVVRRRSREQATHLPIESQTLSLTAGLLSTASVRKQISHPPPSDAQLSRRRQRGVWGNGRFHPRIINPWQFPPAYLPTQTLPVC